MLDHIIILGAGISGLATAWFLRKYLGSGVQLTLIDKNQRAGGWIQTVQIEDFLFEQGPRSCRSRGAGQETLALIEALGLQDQVIVPHLEARHRYVYYQRRLQRLPQHLWEIPFNSLTRGWGKALWRDWNKPKRKAEDESIQTFFDRRLGQPWADRLIDPFVSGIYAGDCSHLSLKSCFPLFDQWEQKKGSLLWGALRHRTARQLDPMLQSPFIQSLGRSSLFSFKEGMETLPQTLAQHLKGCLFLGQAAYSISFSPEGVEVKLKEGMLLKGDRLISTLPTFALSPLLGSYPSIAEKLNKLHYATVVVVNFGFNQSILPLKGFGYLIPSMEGSSVLGCVWDSCVFPQQNRRASHTRLTVMMGGSRHPEVEHLSEPEVIEQASLALHQQLGLRIDPQVIQIKKAQCAIPQYEVGYQIWKQDLQEAMLELSPHFTLSGNAFAGVSVNDCIVQARYLAQQIARVLK